MIVVKLKAQTYMKDSVKTSKKLTTLTTPDTSLQLFQVKAQASSLKPDLSLLSLIF